MRASVWIAAYLATAAFAQDACPPVVFQGPAIVPLTSRTPTRAVGLVRQPDRSFTAHVYQNTSPYTLIDKLPNFERGFFSCFGHPARSLGSQPVSMEFAEPVGSAASVFSFAALGTGGEAKAVLGTFAQFNRNGLAAGYANSDLTPRVRADVPVDEATRLLLVADFNGDGIRDAFVFSSGAQQNNASAGFLAGNPDGSFAAAALTSLGGFVGAATAQDFDKNGQVDVAVFTGASSGGSFQLHILRNAGGGSFTRITTPMPALCFAAIAADFNNDGNPDLVCADSDTSLRLLAGNGDGTFRAPVSVTLPMAPAELAFGDLNADGNLDIAVHGRNGQGVLGVLLGNGALAFPSQRFYASGYDKYGLLIADFDADGRMDVIQGYGHSAALTHQGPLSLTVHFGRGDGSLASVPALIGPAAGGLQPVVADFNGDSRPDIVIPSRNGAYSVFFSAADGSFTPGPTGNLNVTGLAFATAADLNGDGRPDLGLAGGNGIHVALNDGTGRFGAAASVDATSGILQLDMGDFNGDGRIDIVAARGSTNPSVTGEVLTFLGGASGAFTKGPILTPGQNPVQVLLRDLNTDGRPELIVVLRGIDYLPNLPGGLAVYPGTGGTFANPTNYAFGMNPSGIAAGDFNGDGLPDLAGPTRVSEFSFRVGVLLSTAGGGFSAPTFLTADFGPGTPGIVDLNGDGLNDLLLPHCCGDTEIGYLLNRGGGAFFPATLLHGNASVGAVVPFAFPGDALPGFLALPSEAGVNSLLFLYRNASARSTVAGAVSAASFKGPDLAPGAIASIFGTNLASSLVVNNQATPPEELGGVRVTLRDAAGVERKCGLFFVSPGQVNVLLPFDGVTLGPAVLTTRTSSGGLSTASIRLVDVSPGLFAAGTSGLAAANLLRIASDGTQTAEPVVELDAGGQLVARPIVFGPESEQLFLVLYATGIRGRVAAPRVQAIAGDASQTVTYAGPQGFFPGLEQVNVRLNRNLAGRGLMDVLIRLNFSTELESNRVRVRFQ